MTNRELTDLILLDMSLWKNQPDIIMGALKDMENSVKRLPLSHQIEIEHSYNQIMKYYYERK